MTALAATPDGLWIASGCSYGTIILWSMVDHDLSPVLDWGAHREPIRQLQFSPDGQRLASNSHTQIRIWDTVHGTPIATLLADERNHDTHPRPNSFQLYFASMVWSPLGTIIAYTTDGHLRWWDPTASDSALDGICRLTGRELAETTQPAHDIGDLTGTHHSLFYSIISSDGELLVAVYEDGVIMTWDISELKDTISPSRELSLLSGWQKQPRTTGSSVCHAVATSDSRMRVLIVRQRGTLVDICDACTDTRIVSLEHDNEVSTAHVSQCGKLVVTSTYLPEGQGYHLWRVSDGTCLESFEENSAQIRGSQILLAADGQALVRGNSDGTVLYRSFGQSLM